MLPEIFGGMRVHLGFCFSRYSDWSRCAVFPARLMTSKTQMLCHVVDPTLLVNAGLPMSEGLDRSPTSAWETLSKRAAGLGAGMQRENTRFGAPVPVTQLLSVVSQGAASWYRNSCPATWTWISTRALGYSVVRLPCHSLPQELLSANNKRERSKCR